MKSKLIKSIVTTEKSVRLMEAENKITIIVNIKATKNMIKKEIERVFDVKVDRVNVAITKTGLKKAYVKLKSGSSAIDIATKFGMM